MTTVEYAKRELARIGGEDEPIQMAINKNILDILEVFDNQNHSGFSAGYLISALTRLIDYKPLTPLTGEEDEWNGRQNKRYSAVFRNEDGSAYNIEGRIFSNDGGKTWYGCRDSWVPVTFPYTVPDHPERIIVDE